MGDGASHAKKRSVFRLAEVVKGEKMEKGAVETANGGEKWVPSRFGSTSALHPPRVWVLALVPLCSETESVMPLAYEKGKAEDQTKGGKWLLNISIYS